jgi:tetratricopeptide (TPR) repeat protein
MHRRALLLAALLSLLPSRTFGAADDPVRAARTLLAAWHEDPVRIDRARALLEAAVATDPTPATLVELSRVWFLTGDFRARTHAERLAVYEKGSAVARRAIAAGPRDDGAHLWLALNTARLAELRGALRAIGLLATVRDESRTVLALNPASVEGLILAGSLASELPPLMGGDDARAETLLARALELDPHHTAGRLQLARFYLAEHRWRDAERELLRVVNEPAPSDLPRWMIVDRPRAHALLSDLYASGRITPTPQAP